MEQSSSWANLGKIVCRHSCFRAETDTKHQGARHYIAGPSRGPNEQAAHDDLARIRASVAGSATQLEALQKMKSESQRLQMEAKATRKLQGSIEEGSAYSFRACIQYWDEFGKHAVRGPARTSRRRADADLVKLREASQRHDTWPQQLRAVQAEVEQLYIQAQRENGVALGIDMYEARRMAHKTDDSDPSDGDDDEGYEEPCGDLDFDAAVKLLEEPDIASAVQQPAPIDANEATVPLACFRPINEPPEALERILLARADPNLVVGEDISPLRKVIAFARTREVAAMRDLLLQHGATESKFEKQRWEERQAAEECEQFWLHNFHRDDREGVKWHI